MELDFHSPYTSSRRVQGQFNILSCMTLEVDRGGMKCEGSIDRNFVLFCYKNTVRLK